MDGFRMTFGFSRNSSEAECADGEGADEGIILVCSNTVTSGCQFMICNLGLNCIHVFCRLFAGSTNGRRYVDIKMHLVIFIAHLTCMH